MRDRPDELKHQLATLWRAARTGIDTVKEIAVRSSQAGRLRFDVVLLRREREQLLAALGRQTCDFLDEPTGTEVPEELLALHARIRDVEGRIKTNAVKAADNAFGAPRGFEPEAAVDYGDDSKVEDPSDELFVEEVKRAPVTERRKKKRTAKK